MNVCKITLADGTVLENLELNGNNYISSNIIDNEIFEGNLDEIVISDGENDETYSDMRLMSNRVVDGRSWFVLGEKSLDYKEKETYRKRITALEEQLAETDEAAILLYEASLEQEAVNSEQDEAIIEIYEMMEEMSNG